MYAATLWTLFILSPVVLVLLLFVTAPYGRYNKTGWGPVIDARTAWLVMELPAVVIPLTFWFLRTGDRNIAGILVVMWLVHYCYRTFAYPFFMGGGGKRFPIVLVFTALFYNTANGYVNGSYLFRSDRIYTADWLLDPRFLIGALLFFAGFAIHIGSDRSFRKLRKLSKHEYSIPSGGLFELITAPNYFGEILQWFGWALASWSLPGLAFALFTTANLLPRAISHHRWYRDTYPDYPSRRKAIIPFLL